MPLRHEPLDLKLVCKLIELKRVDAGAKSARGRSHAELFPSGRRLLARSQSPPQHFVISARMANRREQALYQAHMERK